MPYRLQSYFYVNIQLLLQNKCEAFIWKRNENTDIWLLRAGVGESGGMQKVERPKAKAETEDDSRTTEEKQQDLDAAKSEFDSWISSGVYSEEAVNIKLDELKQKYHLASYELMHGGGKTTVVGKVNPEYKAYINQTRVLGVDNIEDIDMSNLQTFFRAVSVKELNNIIKNGIVSPRVYEDGSQKGEFGLTSHREYAINNIIMSKSNKNKKGKMPIANSVKAKYAVLLEIRVLPGTQEHLINEFGVQFPGQAGHELTNHLPTVEEGSTNIIEMKIERVTTGSGTIENINYMFKSVQPKDGSQENPLTHLNDRIVEIKIIGGIVPEGTKLT